MIRLGEKHLSRILAEWVNPPQPRQASDEPRPCECQLRSVYWCTADRIAFVKRLKLMAPYPHRLLVITSTLSQVKSPYAHTSVDPNRTMQFLVATLAGLQVPFICSETHELGEELVGSYLYQVYLYHWLESHDYGRFLSDNDL